MITGQIRYTKIPVYIFDADQRDRSQYIAFIIADGDKAVAYPCNAEDLIFDDINQGQLL